MLSSQCSGLAIHRLPDLRVPPKAILVTGATGFIGQRLVSELLRNRHSVRVLVRPGKKTDKRVPPACEQISVELTDVENLVPVIAESSSVIYCAGSVRGRNPEDFFTANIQGVKAILGALKQVHDSTGEAPPILLLSSLAASQPQLSDYANSKYQGEKILQDASFLDWCILRPPAVYGPGDREMLPLLKWIRRGLLVQPGPLDQRLSLLHVDDLVRAIVCWLSAPKECSGKTYAIDDGMPGGYSWQAIGEAVDNGRFIKLRVPEFLLEVIARTNLLFSSVMGYAPMLTPGKVRELRQSKWLCRNDDFTDATGWKPRLGLGQGVQHLFP